MFEKSYGYKRLVTKQIRKKIEMEGDDVKIRR